MATAANPHPLRPSVATATASGIPELVELRQGEVSLRLLVMRDAAGLAAAGGELRAQRGEVTAPSDLESAYRTITTAYHQLRADAGYAFAIRWQERIVGATSYIGLVASPATVPSPVLDRGGPLAVEIGHTWLAPSAQRPELAAAVAFLLLQHAFETWQVQRVRMRCAARDAQAAQAIAAAGLRCDGLLRGDAADGEGTLRDALVYSLLAEEWPQVRSGLLPRLELQPLIRCSAP
jgi:RimJ/RimL family protein N-acetyltransferase